jgi:hypothetical protein
MLRPVIFVSARNLRNRWMALPLRSQNLSGEHAMKSINNACLSALLCGAVIFTLPAMAAPGAASQTGASTGAVSGATGTSSGTGVGAMGQTTSGPVTTPAGSMNNQANADAGAATSTNLAANGTASTGGMNASGDINTPSASNNAGSVNSQDQTPAKKMNSKAQADANAAVTQTTGKPQ